MNRKLLVIAPAVGLALLSGPSFAQNTGDCRNMLTASVGLSLDAEGYDTDNVCHLTVGELALIKNLLTEEGMGSRQRIQHILDAAS